MRIAMFTNTYLPQVGGVAQSVWRFTSELREMGHRVLVVAPQYSHTPEEEADVVRIPALPKFNGSDFSVALPVSLELSGQLDRFEPELLHAHHPFLLGNTAARVAASRNLPLVFTHHTMYERYTHYVPLESDALADYVRTLSTRFANLCEHVVAPSESLADMLAERGVSAPVSVVPTGVDLDRFADGSGERFRQELDIDPRTLLIGHVGRLAPEKNLRFLTEAVALALGRIEKAAFVVVGQGPSSEDIREVFDAEGLGDRLVLAGVRKGQALVDAYLAMDAFAFASKTETQGMVLAEALAAGCPLAALDAPGAREVVRDGQNGRLVPEESLDAFASALVEVAEWARGDAADLAERCRQTARPFGTRACAENLLEVYRSATVRQPAGKNVESDEWSSLLRSLEREWRLWSNRAASAADALMRGLDGGTGEQR